ncbi:polysaccharide biosynthesis tyrosine autokinase [Mycobacterium sp. CBMA293]|uniref:polysaccharide biosynthesis tyrosine autokinase n=1 Tax=unclassified Mycolicibacterium TaxID=2636767 RepID=UPI0012DCC44A|nr:MULTISPECIES: polysaccharide biosynthesis tyrosine autokinase [unclassified Mycolicibacterium]MUL47839.1 polysaccharide biosynthesis tyrosine autokinase [Mycolicibacterium sp. CBMA 360]MUL59314.1 polysaccharide biosynthesis tyrosine autokinase [Mycolicibacterium sp. CBMA 335]MUL71039.1 polysaccharide biosynthesis tyrosine autokinase [Mycolicibacterium sp. CBMA 311]MUL94682.1 polysaccharide biosynthesis tyrosine autokinase [Mycolicibacterium sp. CBMA 230]MUM09140.1 protein tyrosine kinase [M
MNLQNFLKILRQRWITVGAAIVLVMLVAVAITVTTTPLYKSSTRLFVSTNAGNSLFDTYQGNLLSQERISSYTALLTGEALAQRTVNALHSDISTQDLRKEVTARSKAGTVLIDVDVLDPSPVRARDIANTLSNEFVAMVRDLESPGDGSVASTRVIIEQPAVVASSPAVPNVVQNIAFGLVAGILFGVALAVGRDALDKTVKKRADLESITNVGIVGDIPLDKDRRAAPAISFGGESSHIAESFRKLRTNLSFLAVDNPPRVIVVTSSVPNEGKSTTAINIALALAEIDNHVLLVDGDMRRSIVHRHLKLEGAVGLSTVLSGAVSLPEALQETQFPGLTILAAGTTPPNPSELLASQATKKLLAELRGQFDYVIVDSPPLLAVTDAALLAASTDGALLLARYGHTKQDQLMYATEALQNVGAALLGTVLTMTPSRDDSYYAGAYHYYHDRRGGRHSRET